MRRDRDCATCGHPEWKHFGDGRRCEHLTRNRQCPCTEYRPPDEVDN